MGSAISPSRRMLPSYDKRSFVADVFRAGILSDKKRVIASQPGDVSCWRHALLACGWLARCFLRQRRLKNLIFSVRTSLGCLRFLSRRRRVKFAKILLRSAFNAALLWDLTSRTFPSSSDSCFSYGLFFPLEATCFRFGKSKERIIRSRKSIWCTLGHF